MKVLRTVNVLVQLSVGDTASRLTTGVGLEAPVVLSLRRRSAATASSGSSCANTLAKADSVVVGCCSPGRDASASLRSTVCLGADFARHLASGVGGSFQWMNVFCTSQYGTAAAAGDGTHCGEGAPPHDGVAGWASASMSSSMQRGLRRRGAPDVPVAGGTCTSEDSSDVSSDTTAIPSGQSSRRRGSPAHLWAAALPTPSEAAADCPTWISSGHNG
mmetsp:Transcript_39198/g.90907  ORF Transcript_39198/g.90907 Transcript_39198/m.90907 type:complete len:217 (-) Transcript_39198:854-1504(-)